MLAKVENKQPEGLPEGIYFDLSDEDYHKDPALSSSGIKKLLPAEEGDQYNPMEYWDSSPLNPNREPIDTAAFKYGRAFHGLVLQPEIFNKGFIVLPAVNDIKINSEVWAKLRDTEDGKDFILPSSKTAEVVKYAGPKTIIRKDDYNSILIMKNEIMRSPFLRAILSNGHAEVSIFWRDERTGIMCKVRFDWLCPDWILDLKTLAGTTASKRKLRYEATDRMYQVSGAFYLEGYHEAIKRGWYSGSVHNEFILLYCGKTRPYTPRVMRINEEKLYQGRKSFNDALDFYKSCIERFGASRWSDDTYKVEDLFAINKPSN